MKLLEITSGPDVELDTQDYNLRQQAENAIDDAIENIVARGEHEPNKEEIYYQLSKGSTLDPNVLKMVDHLLYRDEQ